MPRPAAAHKPAERGREEVAGRAERGQVVRRDGPVGRVLPRPVVRLDGLRVAAHPTETARESEALGSGAPVIRMAAAERERVR